MGLGEQFLNSAVRQIGRNVANDIYNSGANNNNNNLLFDNIRHGMWLRIHDNHKWTKGYLITWFIFGVFLSILFPILSTLLMGLTLYINGYCTKQKWNRSVIRDVWKLDGRRKDGKYIIKKDDVFIEEKEDYDYDEKTSTYVKQLKKYNWITFITSFIVSVLMLYFLIKTK